MLPLARQGLTSARSPLLLRTLHSSSLLRSPLPRSSLVALARSPTLPPTFFTPSSSQQHIHSSPPNSLLREPNPDGTPLKSTLWSRSPILRVLTRLAFSSVLGLFVLTGAILVHDSLTYGSNKVGKVDVHPLALKPEKGGRKNLPILAHDIQELEEGHGGERKEKPKLVIVGGGWGVSPSPLASLSFCPSLSSLSPGFLRSERGRLGSGVVWVESDVNEADDHLPSFASPLAQSVGLLKTLHDGDYNVTVVAPQNYSLFVRPSPLPVFPRRVARPLTSTPSVSTANRPPSCRPQQ